VLVCTVVLFAAALEGALRVIFARSFDFSMEMWKYAVELKRPVADPQLSFVHVPNRSAFLMGVEVSINSEGRRDRDYPRAKPADVYRIIMLGDSTTLGWGVPLDQTVAKLLESDLNRNGRYEVINAGVGNYGTVQEVAHYKTYDRSWRPDLVILEYFINDAEPVPREATLGLISRSYLLSFTASRYDAMLRLAGLRPQWNEYYAGLYKNDQAGLRAAQDALRELAHATSADGARLLVAILPELHRINGEYPFARAHEKIKAVLAATHTPVIELIESLRDHGPESSLWVTPADPHPNGKANALIAGALARWIREHVR